MNQKNHSVENLAVYCKLGVDAWHKVISYNETEVSVAETAFSFSEIWYIKKQETRSSAIKVKKWNELHPPLPDVQLTCWGYAFTYATRRKETLLQRTFQFHKSGPAQNMFSSIRSRPIWITRPGSVS
jgi:hypothetical protein